MLAAGLTAVAMPRDHGGPSWGAVLSIFGLAVGLVAALVRPLLAGTERGRRNLATALGRLAAGDLTVRIEAGGRDEFAAMTASVDELAARLRLVFAGVERAAVELKERHQQVHAIGESMSSTAEVSATQAMTASAYATEVANNMHVVAAANEELSITVREIASHAAAASRGAHDGIEQADLTNTTVRELGVASQSVGDVAGLISSIAKQTKLLALNARIEAARAGETNHGFVVIAQEVRQLAQNTADATESVGRSAAEISSGSDRAGRAIAVIQATIARVSESQASIAAAVEQQSGATREIGRLSAETANGSTEIVAHIKQISQVTRRLAYGGSQGRDAASTLAELELKLRRLLEPFTLDELVDEVQAVADVAPVAQVRGDVTVIKNTVIGPAVNAFTYDADWCHSATNEISGESDSYCSTPDSTATVRFFGRRARFYGVIDAHHGMVGLSVDDGDETIIDEYSPTRAGGVMLFETPILPDGEHVLRIRVADEKHPDSRYFWATIDRVEVV